MIHGWRFSSDTGEKWLRGESRHRRKADATFWNTLAPPAPAGQSLGSPPQMKIGAEPDTCNRHPRLQNGRRCLHTAKRATKETGGYGGCCPRFPSLDRRGLMLFRLISVVVRQARLALAVFLVWKFYRLLGSLLPD